MLIFIVIVIIVTLILFDKIFALKFLVFIEKFRKK